MTELKFKITKKSMRKLQIGKTHYTLRNEPDPRFKVSAKLGVRHEAACACLLCYTPAYGYTAIYGPPSLLLRAKRNYGGFIKVIGPLGELPN